MMFSNVGYRPRTEQRIRLGATKEGRLLALRQDYLNVTSQLDDFDENCGEATPYLYSVANLQVTSGLVRRNLGAPMYMRGPGAVPGLFGLEAAMNELADELKIDPLQLRVLNDAKKDEDKNLPFSSRHFRECFEVGAKKFGWERRTAGIGRRKLGRTNASMHCHCRVPCQRPRLSSQWHTRHRHRHVHDFRAGRS
jgi:xanthine dehydrogenase YagR molybdenum-binding subunit